MSFPRRLFGTYTCGILGPSFPSKSNQPGERIGYPNRKSVTGLPGRGDGKRLTVSMLPGVDGEDPSHELRPGKEIAAMGQVY